MIGGARCLVEKGANWRSSKGGNKRQSEGELPKVRKKDLQGRGPDGKLHHRGRKEAIKM